MKKLLILTTMVFATIVFFGNYSVSAKPAEVIMEPTIYEGVESGEENGYLTFDYNLFAGQHIYAGTLTISNDDENLYLNFEADGVIQQVHVYVYDSLEQLPSKRPAPGLAPYVLEDVNDFNASLTIPMSELNDGETYYLIVHLAFVTPDGETDPVVINLGGETGYAAGEDTPDYTGKGAWFYIIGYTVTETDDGPGPVGEFGSETAWAFGNDFSIQLNTLVNQNRWGWTNGPLDIGTYEFDIYAAAGNNDLSKGTLVGSLIIIYDGNQAIVTYDFLEGFYAAELHLYVGNDVLPLFNNSYTISPGLFPYTDDSVMAYEYTFVISNLSGPIYVAAHATVYGYY